jgi:DNA-binding HxlR family transcriptional regulator
VDEEAAQRSSKRTDMFRAVLHSRSERASDAVPRSGERNCSVARTVDIVSDAWAFLIIREAFFGAHTFEAFRAALDIPRATLTDRLRSLTRQGIFRQVAPTRDSRRKEYRLTKAGFDLYSSFVALMQFGDRWLAGKSKPPLTLVHSACDCESHPLVACSECLKEARANEVTYRDGPGAGQTAAKLGRNARRSSDDNKFLLGRPSSVSRALQVIGDKWSFMVVREAFFGVRRYDQIQANLNIAPNILTDRLLRFVAKGIFRKRLYQRSPPRYEYLLTDMGRDLYGPFITMMAWGDRWLSGGKAPLILTHQTCGKDFNPVVICDRCRKPIDASVMQYKLSYNPEAYGGGGPRDMRSTSDGD